MYTFIVLLCAIHVSTYFQSYIIQASTACCSLIKSKLTYLIRTIWMVLEINTCVFLGIRMSVRPVDLVKQWCLNSLASWGFVWTLMPFLFSLCCLWCCLLLYVLILLFSILIIRLSNDLVQSDFISYSESPLYKALFYCTAVFTH